MMPTVSSRSLRFSLRHFLLSSLCFERDLVADELERLLRRARRRTRGQDLQPHGRADLTADDLHDVVQAPADDVDHLALLAFPDGDDAIVRIERAGDSSGSARQDVEHRHVVVNEL